VRWVAIRGVAANLMQHANTKVAQHLHPHLRVLVRRHILWAILKDLTIGAGLSRWGTPPGNRHETSSAVVSTITYDTGAVSSQTRMDAFSNSKLHVVQWREMSSPVNGTPCPRQIPQHADSGYATRSNTAFTSPVGSSQNTSEEKTPQDEFAHSNTRSVPLPGREDLYIIRRDLDYTSNARFREIAPSMQQLLQKSMPKQWSSVFQSAKAKSKRPHATMMSMRLMVVGATAETAKPSIVIFLAGDQTRCVEAALEQPSLRGLYRSNDGVTPSFDVIVVGQEPRKRSYREVSVVWEASRQREKSLSTFCGVQICLDAGGGRSAAATLGGIVKLTYGPGDFKLVGMTAGHPIHDLLDPESDAEHLVFKHPRALGTVLHPLINNDIQDDDQAILVPKRDWALVEMNSPVRMRPNLMHIAGNEGGLNLQRKAPASQTGNLPLQSRGQGHSMTAAPPASFPDINPIEVVLLGGSSHFSGAMVGLLSHMLGAIMLSPDDGFVDAYLLTLDEGQELQDGDSGSWVVNPVSLEVYGHVVATDMTGDVYVIPLHESLEEMKDALGVESVSLLGTADILDAALLQDLKRSLVLDDADSGYVSVASAVRDTVSHNAETWVDDDTDAFDCW